MDKRDWMILKALHEYKNITKTAHHLYMSQPSLTHRLQQIEQEFGVCIVQRNRRGVDFTPEGEYLAKSADEMLLKLRQIQEQVMNMRQEVTGTLRLGVVNFFTRNQLPPLLKQFKDRYPNVEFKVITGWSGDVYQFLYNHDVHIGFVRGDYPWRDGKHLIQEETLCIASKTELDLKRLPEMSRIDYQTDHYFQSIIDQWWSENYDKPPHIGMEVDKAESCKAMVLNGLGYAILPSLLLEDTEDLFKVNLKDAAGNLLLRKTWMYYHPEYMGINMVRAFVEFVQNYDIHQ